MALLSFLFNSKPKTASAAKERLQIIIARERNGRAGPDFLPALHQELIAVISKYVKVNPCLLYTSPSPRDKRQSRMPSSA